MTLDQLSPLRGEYPTLDADLWTHRSAAREVAQFAPPDVVSRILSGRDPLVRPELVTELQSALLRWGGAAEQRQDGARARTMVA